MADDAATATVPQARRVALLANLLPFAVLPVEAQQRLAALLSEEHYAAGRVVVAEGEPGETLYLIVEGQAAVTLRTPSGPVALTTLGPGELFGELALLMPGQRRQATVTALAPLLVLRLTAPVFAVLLDTYPLARRIWAAAADALLVATVLKAASPFTALDAAHLRRLATRFKARTVAPGTLIVRQGDRWGYACYLLCSGRAEVLRQDGDATRCLAILGPGTLFGEHALLTGQARTATVRALEPCALLVLHRPDLLAALAADPDVGVRVRAVLRRQDLPRGAPSPQ
jgi:cAMP-dependent protein kinase regulator